MTLSASHLLGTLDLLQKGAELLGLCIESPAHGLVVVGGVGGTGHMGCAQLKGRERVFRVMHVYRGHGLNKLPYRITHGWYSLQHRTEQSKMGLHLHLFIWHGKVNQQINFLSIHCTSQSFLGYCNQICLHFKISLVLVLLPLDHQLISWPVWISILHLPHCITAMI